jgi:hypothetical protein
LCRSHPRPPLLGPRRPRRKLCLRRIQPPLIGAALVAQSVQEGWHLFGDADKVKGHGELASIVMRDA